MKKESKEGGDVFWNIIGYVSILIIVISIANIGLKATGYATTTDTAIVNVTVSSQASINFSSDLIEFGAGSVSPGESSAVLESNGTASTNGNWSWSAQSFVLENIGNVNVTLDLKATKLATTMIGGNSPSFQYAVKDTEAGSCLTPGVTFIAWTNVNTTMLAGNGVRVCGIFGFNNTVDRISIDVRLVIPSDSYTGTLTDTFTATGTSA